MSDPRRRILDASIELVADQGVRAVSFREAARRAGVSHQTPYHYFGDYQGILVEIAREGFALLADAMDAAARSHEDPMDALTTAGIAYVDFARTHVGHFRVMFQRPARAEHRSPLPEAERTHQVLLALAEDAVDAGHGHGLPTDAVAHLCWSTVHGLATLIVEGIFDAEAPLAPEDEERLTRQLVGSLAGLLG